MGYQFYGWKLKKESSQEKINCYKDWKKYNHYIMMIVLPQYSSEWETTFLLQMQRQYGKLTDKQKSLLENIIRKYYPCVDRHLLSIKSQ
jgi:hypothetical protein